MFPSAFSNTINVAFLSFPILPLCTPPPPTLVKFSRASHLFLLDTLVLLFPSLELLPPSPIFFLSLLLLWLR